LLTLHLVSIFAPKPFLPIFILLLFNALNSLLKYYYHSKETLPSHLFFLKPPLYSNELPLSFFHNLFYFPPKLYRSHLISIAITFYPHSVSPAPNETILSPSQNHSLFSPPSKYIFSLTPLSIHPFLLIIYCIFATPSLYSNRYF
jgi:hypothetical protein